MKVPYLLQFTADGKYIIVLKDTLETQIHVACKHKDKE